MGSQASSKTSKWGIATLPPSIYGSLDERSEKIGFCGNIGPESLDTLLLARLYFV